MIVRFLKDWGTRRPGQVADMGGIADSLVRRGFATPVAEPETTKPANKQTKPIRVRVKEAV